MKITLSLLFLLLALPAAAKDCKVKGLSRVTLPAWADCNEFRSNFALAKKMVLDRQWFTEEELEKAWGHVIVTVDDAKTVPCHGVLSWGAGCAERQGLIWLSQEGRALFHELLHMLEDPSAFNHEGWRERGWIKTDAVYRRRCIDLSAY